MTFLFLGLKVHMFTGRVLKIRLALFFLGESKFFIFWGWGGHKILVLVWGKLIFWECGGHKICILVGGFNCEDLTIHLREIATTLSFRGPMITLMATP